MPTRVIKPLPHQPHHRLKPTAAAHRRSATQATRHLLEKALDAEETDAGSPAPRQGPSYWGRRPLVPTYANALSSGAFADGQDSTAAISAARDER